jgi:hypothetical protein
LLSSEQLAGFELEPKVVRLALGPQKLLELQCLEELMPE